MDKLKGKKILVIGGGEWQKPIIEKIKSRGGFVICSNLYSDTPGAKSAQAFEYADVKDIERNISIAKKYSIDAVVTDQSDIAVRTVAHVAKELNLPGNQIDSIDKFTDKLAMRKLAQRHGIKCPKFIEFENLSELLDAIKDIGYPAIVKPRCNQSSRGVVVIREESSIKSAFELCKANANGMTMLLEEYIQGTEYTVEGFKTPSRHYSLTSSIKEHYAHQPNVASRLLYTNLLEDDERQQLHLINDHLIESLGLSFGITHSEFKRDSIGDFYLIETAARGGGTKISSHIIPEMTGIDVNNILLDYACDLDEKNISGDTLIPTKTRFCSLKFLNFEEGTVKSRTSEEKIKKIQGVVDFSYSFNTGEYITKVFDDRSRHAHLICSSNSMYNLNKIEQNIMSEVEVIYE